MFYYEDCGQCWHMGKRFVPLIDYDCDRHRDGCVHGHHPFGHLPTSGLIPSQCNECISIEASGLAGRPEAARQASLLQQWRGIVHHLSLDARIELAPWQKEFFTSDAAIRRRIIRMLRNTVPWEFHPNWAELETDELADFYHGNCLDNFGQIWPRSVCLLLQRTRVTDVAERTEGPARAPMHQCTG